MNTLELKGSLLDLISRADDNTRLARLFEAYNENFSTDETDWWDELPVAQQAWLSQSIEESYDPKNLIDHEEMKKNMLNVLSNAWHNFNHYWLFGIHDKTRKNDLIEKIRPLSKNVKTLSKRVFWKGF